MACSIAFHSARFNVGASDGAAAATGAISNASSSDRVHSRNMFIQASPNTPDRRGRAARAISRHCIVNASTSSNLPASDVPTCAMSFNASAASTAPTIPTSGANHAHGRATRFLEFVAFPEQAVVARGVGVSHVEHRDLPIEADGGAGHQRLAGAHARGVDRMPRGEIVGTVEHHIRRRHQRHE